MAEPALKPVYLLAGSDRPKIVRAVQRLRARFAPEAVELLVATEAGGDGAVAACNALGLFAAGGRLVVVHDVDRWKAADVKAVEAYLGSPSPETTLALVAAEVKADSALAKACARSGEVLRYDVPKRDLSRWVAEQFARVGAHADVEACRALVEMSGDDLQALSSEVEKLATWAAGAQIAATDVEALVSVGGETPPWGLTDAWGRRDARAALLATEGLLRDKTIPALVGTLASHVRRVRACALLDADGVQQGAGADPAHV